MLQELSLGYRLYVLIVKDLLGLYYKTYHRLKVEGAEHLRREGPLFIIINHVSYLEPFALGVALCDHGILPVSHFWTVSKKELFQFPPIGKFLSSLGMFPIDREKTDMAAMRTMLGVFKAGKMIAMAPEGTRSPSGRLQAFQPVVAKIAISRHIPILPAAAIGAEQAMPVGSKFARPKQITIRFGPVFELAEFYDQPLTDAEADRASWMMREQIAALLPAWMRELPPPSGRVGARKV